MKPAPKQSVWPAIRLPVYLLCAAVIVAAGCGQIAARQKAMRFQAALDQFDQAAAMDVNQFSALAANALQPSFGLNAETVTYAAAVLFWVAACWLLFAFFRHRRRRFLEAPFNRPGRPRIV